MSLLDSWVVEAESSAFEAELSTSVEVVAAGVTTGPFVDVGVVTAGVSAGVGAVDVGVVTAGVAAGVGVVAAGVAAGLLVSSVGKFGLQSEA